MPRLDEGARRGAILSALERGNVNAVALEHGVSRQSLHRLVEEAKRSPEDAVREAEEELAFRRRVREIVRGR